MRELPDNAPSRSEWEREQAEEAMERRYLEWCAVLDLDPESGFAASEFNRLIEEEMDR